jgi:hypothetical protein
LDFGSLAVGVAQELTVRLRNCGLADLTLERVALAPGSSPDFSTVSPPAPGTLLAPGAELPVRVRYAPAQDGTDSGGLDIFSDDPTSDPATHRTGTIALQGRGIQRECRMRAAPSGLGFGAAEPGQPLSLALIVANQGSDTCVLESAEISRNTAASEFSLGAVPDPGTLFEPGDILSLEVRYTPADLGPDSGELTLRGNDVSGSDLTVPLSGEGVPDATCDLRVQPTVLDFGTVKPFHTRWLRLELSNQGPDVCQVSGLELLKGLTLPGDFAITAGPTGDFTLARRGEDNDHATLEIAFAPTVLEDHAAVIWFQVTGDPDFRVGAGTCVKPGWPPQTPQLGDGCISLAGRSAESDLEVVPDALDFGVVTLGCNSPEQSITLYNLGYFTITLESVALADPTDPNFEIRQAPPPGSTLGWGEHAVITVRYHPQDESPHGNSLVIQTDDFDTPQVVVALRGEGSTTTLQTDLFSQETSDQTDVLFVVDNSLSMEEEQDALAENFGAFIGWASSQNADFQLGVITTMATGEEYFQGDPPRDIVAGELVAAPGRPRVLTRSTPDLATAFAENVRVGMSPSASTEQGLQAARLALSPPKITSVNAGFLRDSARLVLIFLSDENDQSDMSLDFYRDFFQALKGARNHERLDATAVTGDTPGGCSGPGGVAEDCARYVQLAAQTGGVFQSICTDDWVTALEGIGLASFAPRREFPLSRPAVESTLVVRVDGAVVDRAACPGCAGGFSYYADTHAVYFGDGTVPARGAVVEVTYHTACAGE